MKSNEGPLRGAGVLITRPARQAGALAQKVAAVGGTPVTFPAIVILPPADPVALRRAHDALHRFDYAVFVSANAVEFGAPDPARWPASLVPFAPGQGTAEALASVGITNVRVPVASQDSEGLLALPELMHADGKRVLIFRGDGGREELAQGLRARGAKVEYVACYRRDTPADAHGLDEAFARSRIDAVTITSSEGIDNLWSIVDPLTQARWSTLPTFVPHPRIAEHARKLGLEAILTGPGDAGLMAGLLEWFAARH
ncbi:MAG: uroporphyrinogen-III synthase [Pseudomonadota bacterium]|nr:uroporphyrinogen-III synthase [Pseudomonadota bacterium]